MDKRSAMEHNGGTAEVMHLLPNLRESRTKQKNPLPAENGKGVCAIKEERQITRLANILSTIP